MNKLLSLFKKQIEPPVVKCEKIKIFNDGLWIQIENRKTINLTSWEPDIWTEMKKMYKFPCINGSDSDEGHLIDKESFFKCLIKQRFTKQEQSYLFRYLKYFIQWK